MSIHEDDIKKIAKLARLNLQDTEIQIMTKSLCGIMSWVELLNEVETSDIEPLFSVNVEQAPLRDDVVNHIPMVFDVLQNAPDKGLNMFAVPKVIE